MIVSNNTASVTVIMVTYNTKRLTHSALEALYAGTVVPQQVIVVDNASTDGTFGDIQKDFPLVEYIYNKENKGFAAANNQGIDKASGDLVWLLNSDTRVGKNSLSELISYIENHKDVGVVGPTLIYADGSPQSPGGFFPSCSNVFLWFFPIYKLFFKKSLSRARLLAHVPLKEITHEKELDYVTGAALLLRKSAFENMPLFSECFFMYFEETDLCFRLKQNGWRICAVPTEPVVHIGGGSFRGRGDIHRTMLFIKSLRVFVSAHYRGVRKWALLTEIAICFVPGILLRNIWYHS
ncbi:MAG: glycosyltransferase family 2 protein [Candidatus Pacebacteria bacterium]|nr:glycosyltransferase family 2 protein [Candidatus Paceibacterota bacterium]